MRRTSVRIVIATLFTLLALLPAPSLAAPLPSQPTQGGGNLLVNGGFEGLSCPGVPPSATCKNYTHDTWIQDGRLRDNIETPEGWVTWWQEGGGYYQPEIVLMPASNPVYTGNPPRIRSGFRAVKIFTFSRTHIGGFYQVVTGLQPGATIQLSAFGHSWSCESMDGDNGYATSCGDPWNIALQVGIEPNGVVDPFASSIIWSPEQHARDYYAYIGPATATVGSSGKVVVYLRSKTKWPMTHNDVYWDDAVLAYADAVAVPTATSAPGTPTPTETPAGSPTPRPTPTRRPDGAVVHVVVAGDTLGGIALEYGVSVDDLRRLNAGSIGEGDLIYVGQELVVSASSTLATPAATLIATPASAISPTLAPVPSATPSPAPTAAPTNLASICVLAYHDRDGDGIWTQASEEMLPGAVYTLTSGTGLVGSYTTNGVLEPHCFSSLALGTYRLTQGAPPGYTSADAAQRDVAASGTLSFTFGYRRAGNPPIGPTAAPRSALASTSSSPSRILLIVVGLLAALVLAGGVVFGVVAARRRL